MTTSFLLDQEGDLTIDAEGNLAICDEPYATAQDVACFIKTIKGEVWLDKNDGTPDYLTNAMPLSIISQEFEQMAMTHENVAAATASLSLDDGGILNGVVLLRLKDGQTVSISV